MTKQWLDTRRSYLQKLKTQIGLITGETESSLSDYARSNVSLYKRVWFKDSKSDFIEKALNSSVVLCGDFHSSPSVKRFYIKLFRELAEAYDKPPVVALECFEMGFDKFLSLWLDGEIPDEVLLEKSKWDENWGFSWKGYKKIILELHKLGFKLRSMNSLEENFKKRDQTLAKNIRKIQKEEGGTVFCFIGQHHLGPENLPEKLDDLDYKLKPLCLHLDPEEIYFALQEYNLAKDAQVLSLENHFCFLSTPPWVHWQSHLLHLEELYDDEDDFDDVRGEDYNAVVYDYLQLLCKDLGIAESIKPIDVAFIDEYVVQGETDAKLFKIMQPMLDSETSFYWPEQSEGIMVTNSLNQAASVAGKYLHITQMKQKSLPWGQLDSLNVWCWLEAVGYMLSKFINPKRATIHDQNLSAFLSARLGKRSGANILKTLVKERILELDQSLKLSHPEGLTWSEVVYASRLKGALVGESLFELYSNGGLSSETLRTYLSVPVGDEKIFEPFYKLVLEKLGFE